VTTDTDHASSSVSGVVIHRRKGFAVGAPLTVVRNEMDVVRLEQAVVESWLMLDPLCRRAPAIVAVRDRRTTAQRLRTTLAANRNIAGSADMRPLFSALGDGCQSELELWGHNHVFTHPSLPPSRGQVPVQLGRRRIYLDRVYDEEMVNVELDGAAYHGRPGQRERDLRRDAAVARLGWLTLRYSHPRLQGETPEVRQELLDILAVRRRQLGLRSG
jgi:hypothetical protein